MTTPAITLTIAAAAALLNIWLASRVSRLRFGLKIPTGDGGNPLVLARMRAHANFAEYTPIFLILLGLIEYATGSATWLWLVGIAFIVARIAHAFGMDRPAPNVPRAGGMIFTWLLTLGLAGYALAIPYIQQAAKAPNMIG